MINEIRNPAAVARETNDPPSLNTSGIMVSDNIPKMAPAAKNTIKNTFD